MISPIEVASEPWAFTQRHPLDTSNYISEAKKRGVDLEVFTLRELYKHRLIIPFVHITHRPVRPPLNVRDPSHPPGSTRLQNIRWARDTGRLRDLGEIPYLPELAFERKGQKSRFWWNGLIYSHYQLLVTPELQITLSHGRHVLRGGKIGINIPHPNDQLLERVARFRKIAIALTALEARYLPSLDPEWIHLANTHTKEWQEYRQAYDPVAISQQLGYTSAEVREDATFLLHRAHSIDPIDGYWRDLVRRAPSEYWASLKGDALLAMDYREAAEILLRFYEDLVEHGATEPLPEIPRMYWDPLHERISYHDGTLDADLMRLGLSPHPRVILAVEGESESMHVPLIWKALEYPNAPELWRLLKLGSSSEKLQKVAVLAITPIIGEQLPNAGGWSLIKPPTQLLIAVDPENDFAPSKVGGTRAKIMKEVRDALEAQGAMNADQEDLDNLLNITTWTQSCYEFAHFTDEELADGIMAVHNTINGWTREELVAALGYWRSQGSDIKRVWSSGRVNEETKQMTGKWEFEVSKVKLAEALWPTMQQKIELCKKDPDAPIPEIVTVILDLHTTAQRWRYRSFMLGASSS